ncbi:hypothetical protein ACGF3K_35150 [Streptomyces sp. NPDC047980]|uniref:hypothetical protein n=1 Tax=Streptomyces sp. NPDC047980 TaxID=3365494 RepID=UPI0037246FC4
MALAAGWTLRLAVAGAVSLLAQDREWILAVELLRATAVDAEHPAARYSRDAPAERARAAVHGFESLRESVQRARVGGMMVLLGERVREQRAPGRKEAPGPCT